MKPIDLTGLRFDRLTVLHELPVVGKYRIWQCTCECGGTKAVRGSNLKSGQVRSCGCLLKESIGNINKKHGLSSSREFIIWSGMRSRCNNKNAGHYHRYGGRGISVCAEWQNNFENFLFDMGSAPEGHQLDRIDNELGYLKDNCRWVTVQENCMNTRQNRFIEFNGEIKTVGEWNRYCGFVQGTVSRRLALGWSIDRALTEQPYLGKNQSYSRHVMLMARSI